MSFQRFDKIHLISDFVARGRNAEMKTDTPPPRVIQIYFSDAIVLVY